MAGDPRDLDLTDFVAHSGNVVEVKYCFEGNFNGHNLQARVKVDWAAGEVPAGIDARYSVIGEKPAGADWKSITNEVVGDGEEIALFVPDDFSSDPGGVNVKFTVTVRVTFTGGFTYTTPEPDGEPEADPVRIPGFVIKVDQEREPGTGVW
jgi:hypothetical protein